MEHDDVRTVFESADNRFLLKVREDQRAPVITDLLDYAVGDEHPVIYVSTERPYVSVKEELSDASNIYFIDCVVKTITSQKPQSQENVLFLPGSRNLNAIATAISTAEQRLDAKDVYLVIESIEALITYNPSAKVGSFLRRLEERMDTLDLNLVLFEDSHELEDALGEELYGLTDKVLYLR